MLIKGGYTAYIVVIDGSCKRISDGSSVSWLLFKYLMTTTEEGDIEDERMRGWDMKE